MNLKRRRFCKTSKSVSKLFFKTYFQVNAVGVRLYFIHIFVHCDILWYDTYINLVGTSEAFLSQIQCNDQKIFFFYHLTFVHNIRLIKNKREMLHHISITFYCTHINGLTITSIHYNPKFDTNYLFGTLSPSPKSICVYNSGELTAFSILNKLNKHPAL